MFFTDTHCHIHSQDYPLDVPDVLERAAAAGVTQLICVGTSAADSELAVAFAAAHDNCWAAIGIHPHEAKDGQPALRRLAELLETPSLFPVIPAKAGIQSLPPSARPGSCRVGSSHSSSQSCDQPGTFLSATRRGEELVRPNLDPSSCHSCAEPGGKIVAIGECGLDYFYNHSNKADQQKALRFQIELALAHDLPLIFHVRDAFDDFWPIFDSYRGIRGVIHSFTDDRANLDKLLGRGLYVGVNGIMTFTKNDWQLQLVKDMPLDRIVLETDAPYLTPVPKRGSMNEPAFVELIARFLADLRQESVREIAAVTTRNATQLFSL